MTRVRAVEAADLHERFGAWIRAGADGSPSRDLALHAAHCPRCRRSTAAIDLLLMVDPGRAPMPPSRPAAGPAPALARSRAFAAAAATLVLGAAGAWVGISALADGAVGRSGASPDQEILGGFGAGPTPSAGSATSGAAAPSMTASGAPSEQAASVTPDAPRSEAPAPTPPPPIPVPPTAQPTPTPPPPTATEAPTQRPSRTASPTASPSPTPPPTPDPTPEPTPEPTPLPSEPAAPGF